MVYVNIIIHLSDGEALQRGDREKTDGGYYGKEE